MTRKIVLIALFLSAGIFSFSQSESQDARTVKKRSNRFYVAPVELFFNTLQLGYEHQLKNHNSVAITGGFKLSKKDENIDCIGGTGEFQYRVNLFYNKEASSPITKRYSTFAYFAPYLQYKYEERNDITYPEFSPPKTSVTIINSTFGGVGFGFRFTALENRFCVNMFAGGGLKYSDVKGDKKYTDFFESGYTGFAPKLALQMGIAF